MDLFVAFDSGLLAVSGPPSDPTATHHLTEYDPECVAIGGSTVYCGTTDAGLWRDDGEGWTHVGRSVVDDPVTAVAVNPRDSTEVWAGTEPSAVYRSTDAGSTWEERTGLTDLPSASGWAFPPRPDTHHVRWLEVDPHDPAHLYVAVEAGALVQTHDRGSTWEDRVPDSRRDTHTMTTHPDEPGRAWTAAGDGYAETNDGGQTWTHPQDGLDHRYCWSVVVDPGDPGTTLVSAASGAYAAHVPGRAESYLYRKRDTDAWERLTGLPTGTGVVRATLVAGRHPGELFAASNRGLFRTSDAGDSWTKLDVTVPDDGVPRSIATSRG